MARLGLAMVGSTLAHTVVEVGSDTAPPARMERHLSTIVLVNDDGRCQDGDGG